MPTSGRAESLLEFQAVAAALYRVQSRRPVGCETVVGAVVVVRSVSFANAASSVVAVRQVALL